MLSKFLKPLRYGIVGLPSIFEIDKLDSVTETEKNANRNLIKEETGWDRVVRTLSPKYISIPSFSQHCLIISINILVSLESYPLS